MKVYVLIDNSKSCYDAGHEFVGVFSTKQKAEEYLLRYSKEDKEFFDIEEKELDSAL